MYDLVVSGTCGRGFLNCIRPMRLPWQVTFDLTRMSFCEPLGLVGIAALAERALREGQRVIVRRPDDLNVAHYLSRMRLGQVLAALGAEHDLPWVHERDVGDALLELTAFDGSRGAGVLAAHVHRVVERIEFDAANALHDGICEAGQNVEHHSRRDRGFVAAQQTHGGRELRFAVGDAGVGMLETLRLRGATDDRTALELALDRGVTEMPDPARGNGLPTVIDQLHALEGRLDLLSGSAAVVARGGRRWYAGSREPGFPGTLLQGTVSTGER